MRINPVLKNEVKLSARSFKFNLVILFYVGVLSTIGVTIFYNLIKDEFFSGIYLESIVSFYIGMAIIQAILLMFIVPSLSSTAICSEREKQTLDVLLSTKMTPFSIIIGKLFSSISRVVLLIICTLPIYSIIFFIGGVNLSNIIELSLFFIVATIFVGAISVCISTFSKTSRAATAMSYGMVLLVFIGLIILTSAYMIYTLEKSNYSSNVALPIWAYISPTIGFLSLLGKQLGYQGILSSIYYSSNLDLLSFEHGYLISMGLQLVISGFLILISAYKLNPLHKGRLIKRKK